MRTPFLLLAAVLALGACRGSDQGPAPVPGTGVPGATVTGNPAPPPAGYLPDSHDFATAPLTGKTFATIPRWPAAAEAYGIPAHEPYKKRYFFSDGVLKMEGFGTEGAVVSFLPGNPLDTEAALARGRILAGTALDPGNPRSRDAREIRFEETDRQSGAGCSLILQLDQRNLVTNLVFAEWTP